MNFQVHTVAFEALAFMRQNAFVFRKYLFLPLVFTISAMFLAQVPGFGLALSSVATALAMALLGVSATRFYLYRDPNKVANGANRPFARFFFLTFTMAFLMQMVSVFQMLPGEMQSVAMVWMALMFWINVKICLAFPAIAMDHPGSVWDNAKASLNWTNGIMLKIIASFFLCYSPVIFFTILILKVPELTADPSDFWAVLPQRIFADIVTIFSLLWSYLALAKIYEKVVSGQGSST